MPKRVPELIQPLRLARTRGSVRGKLPLEWLRRLAPSLASEKGGVEIDLHFCRDDTQRLCVLGAVQAELQLTCQRCLDPFRFHANLEVRLLLVKAESDGQGFEGEFEPLVVTEAPISLAEIVEDELMLALPAVPMHPAGTCSIAGEYSSGLSRQGKATQRPFAELGAVKARKV